MNPVDLKNLKVGTTVEGLLYVQSHNKKPQGSLSKAPVNGVAYYQGKTNTFKMWDPHLQNLFSSNDFAGSIVAVKADVGVYNDNIELTLTEVDFNHGETNTSLFFKSVNIEEVFKDFVNFVNANLSEKAVQVLGTVFSNEGLYDPFKMTWAASKMHDAQVGGLMNHTFKMLKIAKTILDNDPRLTPWADLLYLSIVFHDIGKVYEIGRGGTYTVNSFVGHRTFGVEILVRQKEVVIASFGETFFYHILEVITGHHGEYGDKPKNVWGYIVHLIDMLDAQVTGIMDRVDSGDLPIRNGQKVVWNHGDNLVL